MRLPGAAGLRIPAEKERQRAHTPAHVPLTSVAQACPWVSQGLAGRGRSRQGSPRVLRAETGPQGLSPASCLPAGRCSPRVPAFVCVSMHTRVYTSVTMLPV